MEYARAPAEGTMEREANYVAVGAFVLLVIVMVVLFVYWYSDARDSRDYQRYEIYFEGSVSGLTRGAPVRYLGVDVGRVVNLRIDPRDSSRVQVLADIDAEAPVSDKTVALLQLQGVTGVLYVDLVQNSAYRQLIDPVASIKHPVIRSARSNFDVLLASIPDVMSQVTNIADRATRILSDENIAAVSTALKNVENASKTLPATMQEVSKLTADLRSTSEEIRATAASFRNVADAAGPDLQRAMERMRTIADNLARATAKFDGLVEDNRRDLRAFTRDSLPELERLLRDGREAANEVRDLTRSLRENPSQLLYQPNEQGVSIPQ